MLNSGFRPELGNSNGNIKRIASFIRGCVGEYSDSTPFDSSRRIANHAWPRGARLHSDGRIAIALSFRKRWGTPLAGVTDCFEFFETSYRMAGPVLFEGIADISTWTENVKPSLLYGQYVLSQQAFHGEIQRLNRPGDSWLSHRLAYALIDYRGFKKLRQPTDVAVHFKGEHDDRYTFSVKLSGVAFPVFVDFKNSQLQFEFSEPDEKENRTGDISS